MSGPQFFHLQSYSRKSYKAGQSVEQVLAEAARDPVFSGHVENPKPPNMIFGITPEEVGQRHENMVAQGHVDVTLSDGSTARRGIRKDRHTLMTAVASYPLLTKQVAEGSESHEAYQEWIALNVRLLQTMFGDRLVSVIEHVDEEYPHLHAFILPIGDQSCSARHLNPAWQAKEEAEALAKDSGHSPKAAVKLGNAAYRAKAREIQDEYYQHVGLPAGLTRTGPKRERLSRAQWKARKATAQREAELVRQMAQRIELIADNEAGFEKAANQKTEEIAEKIELAESFIRDAEVARDEAQRAADRVLSEAERAAQDTMNAAHRGILNEQNDLQAQKVKLSRERSLFECEKERLLSKSVQETAIVAAKIILGVLAGTVTMAQDRTRLEFKDEALGEKVETLQLGAVLHDLVLAFSNIWNRLVAKLSSEDLQSERDAAAAPLKKIVTNQSGGMEL
ncbi:MAG: hypothetical protein JKY31_10785 [Rhodobacteraceae bacterium]|nr:hypothetical protein [Paracoccaceae bacterium]